LPCEEQLKEAGWFSLEKSCPPGDLTAPSWYLRGGYQEGGTELFVEVHDHRMTTMLINQNHRIIKCFGLEGTFTDHLSQLPLQ